MVHHPAYARLVYLPCLILLFCLGMLAGCSGNAPESGKKKRDVPVIVATAVQEPAQFVVSAVGNVQPQATVAIKTQVGGTIVEQRVRDGQSVNAGDLLFRLDPRPFELAIREAQAKLGRNRILLEKANKDLKRYAQLNKINAVAQEQYDKTYADAKSLESDIQLNLATLERAQLDLSYTVIRAPIPGNVGIVQVNEGNVIKANDDRTLCVINQLEPISISFSLPEKYLPEVMTMRQAGEVTVYITPATGKADDSQSASSSGNSIAAALTAMDNTVDTATGTIKLRAQYSNADKKLWPGQFVRAGLVLREEPAAVLIPTAAVMDGINGSYVYVITPDNKAEDRLITVDFLVGDRTVVSAGLKAGERVALDGQVRLAPGMSVEVRNEPKAVPSPAGAEPAKAQ
ncbi:efflux RND transporter periplasmic adaptor subunit [Desulfovibrio mangrovi]|uniref:efflux RND transporter periplasmic adaptor subunit n=1 Tax=Desulfovibrio mangrovi TaxID=2976983 RepID=UPI002247F243|nr:efflux RND transporter periplasmic adaptor subunit [Desulfovibrio mangrovi]UZP67501.1 efflux RND transporter periplasmic adaptor subunit [Desulfovibrio mangrovi]